MRNAFNKLSSPNKLNNAKCKITWSWYLSFSVSKIQIFCITSFSFNSIDSKSTYSFPLEWAPKLYNFICLITFMLLYRKLKPKWYTKLKCLNQARLTGLVIFCLRIPSLNWTQVLMFESNSYHKEWRSREGHKKVSLTSLFVFQITWLEKCNPMVDPIFRYSAPKPMSIWNKTESRVY